VLLGSQGEGSPTFPFRQGSHRGGVAVSYLSGADFSGGGSGGPSVGTAEARAYGSGVQRDGMETPRENGDEEPPDGLVTVRGAIGGMALLWLAAMAAFGALQASVYAARTAPGYAVVALGAAALSVAAGYGSLRSFGLR